MTAPTPYDEADGMCPNCVTPWKCNGPHEPTSAPTPGTPATTWPSDNLHANLAAEEYVEEAFERSAEERGLSHWHDFDDAELIEMAAWFGAQSRQDEVAAREAAAEQRGAEKAYLDVARIAGAYGATTQQVVRECLALSDEARRAATEAGES